MLPIAGLFIGFAFGWLRARKRGGDRLDRLQYGAAHGIAFAILGLFLTIAIARLGLI